MTFYELLENFFKWAWQLINQIPILFAWLITPTTIMEFEIAPIYLVGGGVLALGLGALIVGLIRAIA